jgi:hypothetical protein
MFIPLAIVILIGTYVFSFREEFDKENLNTVLMVVSAVGVILIVIAVLRSLAR